MLPAFGWKTCDRTCFCLHFFCSGFPPFRVVQCQCPGCSYHSAWGSPHDFVCVFPSRLCTNSVGEGSSNVATVCFWNIANPRKIDGHVFVFTQFLFTHSFSNTGSPSYLSMMGIWRTEISFQASVLIFVWNATFFFGHLVSIFCFLYLFMLFVLSRKVARCLLTGVSFQIRRRERRVTQAVSVLRQAPGFSPHRKAIRVYLPPSSSNLLVSTEPTPNC